jgi:excisionase family DNA binding protein
MKVTEILTIPEVAGLLKIAETTAYLLAQRCELPGFKVGGQWRFSRIAIDNWIRARSGVAVRGARGKAGRSPVSSHRSRKPRS